MPTILFASQKEPISTAPNRRQFLGTLAGFSLFPLEEQKPDLILHSATVHTVDPKQPHAQAIAISGDRILAVGPNDDVLHLASPATKKIDLSTTTVLPGFIDAHSHPAEVGLDHLRMVDCDLHTIAAIQSALRERAARVLGLKYDDTKTSDGRALTIADLDAVAPDHPAFVKHRGGHTAVTLTRVPHLVIC